MVRPSQGKMVLVRDVSKAGGKIWKMDEVDPKSDGLEELVMKVALKTGFAEEQIRFTLNGEPLDVELEEGKPLSSVGITAGTRLFLLLHPKAQRKDGLRAAFKVFDADGNGALGPAEIAGIFTREVAHGRAPMSEEQAKEFIQKFDKDGDGLLDLDEISKGMEEMFWDSVMHGAEEVEDPPPPPPRRIKAGTGYGNTHTAGR